MSVKISYQKWIQEAESRYGKGSMQWKFRCPVCKHVASVEEYRAADAPEGAIAFSCIGRYLPEHNDAFASEQKAPCNYTGGGLFRLNPITVITDDGETHDVFDFSESPLATTETSEATE